MKRNRGLLLSCALAASFSTVGCQSSGNSDENVRPATNTSFSERLQALDAHVRDEAKDESAGGLRSNVRRAMREQDANETTATEEDRALEAQGLEAFRRGNFARAAALLAQRHGLDAGAGATSEDQSALALVAARLEAGDALQALSEARTLWRALETKRTKTLDQALRETPEREAAFLLALSELKSGEVAASRDGVRLLERLVQANPAWVPAYVALSSHYFDARAFALALEVAETGLDRASESDERRGSLLSARARSLRALGRSEEARKLISAALDRYPRDVGVLLWAGVLETDAGFLTSGCERFAAAREIAPESAAASYDDALCAMRAGAWDRARNLLESARAKNPRDAQICLLSGKLSRLRGDLSGARRSWQDFLSLAPESDPRRREVEAALESLGNAVEMRVEEFGATAAPARPGE